MKRTLSVPQIDYIVSFGERLSIHVVSSIVKRKKQKSIAIDSSYLLKTTNDFGNAKVLATTNKETMKKIILDCVSHNVIPVITGFIGHAEDGCITTLGRGGSDYSASSIASIIDADKVILWKDVLGLYTIDPKKYVKAKLMKKVTYDRAITISKNGAKILHKESILPVKSKNIPLYIKCFLQPDATGTLIST